MSTQYKALRLADELDQYLYSVPAHPLCTDAAAELRRLHAENERLHQINQSHEVKLSVRGYEIQIADLEAQRDALLEALKCMASIIDKMGTITRPDPWRVLKCEEALTQARAVIKSVEGEKT